MKDEHQIIFQLNNNVKCQQITHLQPSVFEISSEVHIVNDAPQIQAFADNGRHTWTEIIFMNNPAVPHPQREKVITGHALVKTTTENPIY